MNACWGAGVQQVVLVSRVNLPVAVVVWLGYSVLRADSRVKLLFEVGMAVGENVPFDSGFDREGDDGHDSEKRLRDQLEATQRRLADLHQQSRQQQKTIEVLARIVKRADCRKQSAHNTTQPPASEKTCRTNPTRAVHETHAQGRLIDRSEPNHSPVTGAD